MELVDEQAETALKGSNKAQFKEGFTDEEKLFSIYPQAIAIDTFTGGHNRPKRFQTSCGPGYNAYAPSDLDKYCLLTKVMLAGNAMHDEAHRLIVSYRVLTGICRDLTLQSGNGLKLNVQLATTFRLEEIGLFGPIPLVSLLFDGFFSADEYHVVALCFLTPAIKEKVGEQRRKWHKFLKFWWMQKPAAAHINPADFLNRFRPYTIDSVEFILLITCKNHGVNTLYCPINETSFRRWLSCFGPSYTGAFCV
ncbi:unnamed protein product [Bursaphelenchus xylophilus]|uniref:(pine wood nematode) hypothetical protein n=1 Tax=Bursaphelenchus xylophilus TaxID=6326 RepID=A0A1I7SUK2_BURXY|nr:unnamed protein product [Bursaphelenchus xylophilus]CAG9118637.1 unnamed protein product [Bursaphelenchus xylophilus]